MKTLQLRQNCPARLIVGVKTIIGAAFVLFLFGVGCASQRNSLAEFHSSSLTNLHANKAITADYQDYIRKLSLKGTDFVGSVDFFEDKTGRHAVDINVGHSGKYWEHVLVYDKDNNRVKVIKYRNGGYRS